MVLPDCWGKGVPKYHPQIEAVGALDEATAALGFARALSQVEDTGLLILEVQRDLYQIMAEVTATPENAARFHRWTKLASSGWRRRPTG